MYNEIKLFLGALGSHFEFLIWRGVAGGEQVPLRCQDDISDVVLVVFRREYTVLLPGMGF